MLHRYVATRVLAKDKGYDFSMVAPENFKGSSFMNLDMGKPKGHIPWITEQPSGRVWPSNPEHKFWEEKTNYYNPEFNFIKDNTIIDGEFQDERYFSHRLAEVSEWLKVKLLDTPEDLCVIAHRGGEFTLFPELYLLQEYWDFAISEMRKINPKMKFQVQTDDKLIAQATFPEFEVISNIGYNWRAIRYAHYLIVANSSFSILPSLLGNAKKILAPKYHARHNIGEWSMPQNYYKRYCYIDKKDYVTS